MKLKKIFIVFLLILLLSNSICFGISNKPDITADAAILMDNSTEKILYSKNETQKMYPASTTKILTAILVLENADLNDVVSVPYEAIAGIPSGYSIANLQAGEQLTVEQLVQMLLTHSANDAANALAYHISGSIESFSNLMNKKVSELGLKNSHFENPSGMHSQNHYTTAYDLAIIMKYCMKNDNFRHLISLSECTIPATNKSEERTFDTTNELLLKGNYYYRYAIAGKTGYTSQAKNCLVSVSVKEDLELISVVLGSGLYSNNQSSRFLDTISLFNYGYDNYTVRKLREQNAIATQIEVPNGSKDTKDLELLISNDIKILVKQEDLEKEFSPNIKIDDNITAPVLKGDKLGKIIYNIEGITYSTDLTASHNVERSDFWGIVFRTLLLILIIFLLYKIVFKRKKKKYNYKEHKRKR